MNTRSRYLLFVVKGENYPWLTDEKEKNLIALCDSEKIELREFTRRKLFIKDIYQMFFQKEKN